MATFLRLYSDFGTGWWESTQVVVREELIDLPLLDVLCDQFDGRGWDIVELSEHTAYVESEGYGADGRGCYGRIWATPPHTVQCEKDIINKTAADNILSGRFESPALYKWLYQNGYIPKEQ